MPLCPLSVVLGGDDASVQSKFLRRDLFDFIRNNGLFKRSIKDCTEKTVKYIIERKKNIDESLKKQIYLRTKNFISKLVCKWKKHNRTLDRFLNSESKWLEQEHIIKEKQDRKNRGRPKKQFSECGDKSRKEKVSSLLNYSPEELSFAAVRSYQQQGKRSLAEVIKKAVGSSPKSIKKLKTPNSPNAIIPYTPEEALALITDLKLTKHQYRLLQASAKSKNANIYPTYDSVLEIKKQCYPSAADSKKITETLCELKLQPLVDLTIQRLALVQKDVFETHCHENNNLECIWKWGCDGAGGHSRYKQRFSTNEEDKNDANILMTSIVPLQLIKREVDNKIVQYWSNPRTSSPRYCRPVRFSFTKETSDVIEEEFNRMDKEINSLQPTYFVLRNKTFTITHTFLKTMVDGKTCNAVMKNRASAVCYICQASPKHMNDLQNIIKRPCNENAFALGLSTLHAQIRSFETLIHLSYKLEVQCWQARGNEAKKRVEEKKNYIQNRLRTEMGLLVDIPKQGGGNTNDGNSARKFFKDPEKSANIIGIDVELVKRFAIILSTLSSGYSIKTDKFKSYCFETAEIFVTKYPWYRMPVSIHKILIHSADIIDSFPVPIGQLSEDVQEARQKDWKKFREGFARKTSRIDTNTDIVNNLLISSDPMITSLRKLPWRRSDPLSSEVLELLKYNDLQ